MNGTLIKDDKNRLPLIVFIG